MKTNCCLRFGSSLALGVLLVAGVARADEPATWEDVAPKKKPTVEVSFEPSYEQNSYLVTARKQKCETPCALQLPAGEVKVLVEGHGQRFRQRIEVPEGPATAYVQHYTRNRAIWGGVLLGLTAPFAALTVLSFLPTSYYRPVSPGEDMPLAVEVGAASAVGAAACLVGGIVLVATVRKAGIVVRPTRPAVDEGEQTSMVLP